MGILLFRQSANQEARFDSFGASRWSQIAQHHGAVLLQARCRLAQLGQRRKAQLGLAFNYVRL